MLRVKLPSYLAEDRTSVILPLFGDLLPCHDDSGVGFSILGFDIFLKQEQIVIPMAVVAGRILWRLAPDVVRGCHFPGRQRVEIGECVFYIKLKGFLIHGNVSQYNIFLGPFFRSQRIQTDLEIEGGSLGFKIF